MLAEKALLFALISSVSATVFIQAPCPDVKPVDNFNITAYAQGTWYEISRYPNDWENRGDCVSKVFKPENGNYNFKLSDSVDGKLDYFEGYIKNAPNAGSSGIIDYYSPAYEGSEGVNVVPVYILGIDYDKFSIGYECKYDEKKKIRHDFAWVMSRTKTLDDATKAAVYKILKSTSFIDTSKFLHIHYTPDACALKP